MEYLKAFTIGTSGLVTFLSLSEVAIDEKYDYSDYYSFIIPIYYGLMVVLSVFLGKTFNLSLKKRILITSIISILFVLLFNYKTNKYENYYEENKYNLAMIVIKDITLQLIIFNIIIFYLIINFSKYWLLKIFIIGSSIFLFLSNYLNVKFFINQKKNYDFKFFSITEPLLQSFGLVIGIYIGKTILKLNLVPTIIIYHLIAPFIVLFLVYRLKLYPFNDNFSGNFYYVSGMIIAGLLECIPFYYLNKYLK